MNKDNIKIFSYKLVAKQFDISEELAKKWIMSGQVFLNDDRSYKITNDLKFLINTLFWKNDIKYIISRGEEKLKKAINIFLINVKDKICLDVGASTGGFTKTLLDHHAKYVYAIDSGENQLAYSIRIDPRVKSMEKYNFRYAKLSDFNHYVMDLITVDVSHISIIKLLKNIEIFADINSDIVILIKPQFEAKYEDVIDGLVKNKYIHQKIIENIINEINKYNMFLSNITYSPITGKNKKNIEYFIHIKKNITQNITNYKNLITKTINESWNNLYHE